ncbi:hypothetical protein [Streptomyces cavernicola]|uniref:Serine/arginine repetitive matrix protein 2 n=1 Tax=Streptomyces cavernicola TaxID=3043613 RepID=A0ABT6SBA1_9ACTN|nr:hypothetical protein [Streptomyces sp. B-S-A6]MDI3405463.1 hypothetical protein [Streptomyces sp. B-S-A6]
MADQGQGGVRWNPETQSWDTGGPQPAPYTPPPPPRPEHAPGGGEHAPGGGEQGPGGPQFGPLPSEESSGLPPWQPPVPEPQSRPWYRRGAVVGSVVVAVLAAGLGSYLLWGRGAEPAPDAKPSAPPSVTGSPPADQGPTGEPDPAESTESASPSASVPAGYRAAAEPEFTLAVPEDWERRTEEGKNGVTLYYYEAPEGPERLQVFQVTEDAATPMSTVKLAEKDLKRLPGYERNALGPVSHPHGEAAELDYTYMSDEWSMELRTLDRIVPGGPDDPTLWAVLSIGPADDWPGQRQVMEDALGSFTTAG